MRVRVLPALLVLVLMVGTGCQVDVGVTTRVREDGSGEVVVEVELDEEASARIPDLEQELAVEDLEAAGWSVEPPEETEGGGLVLEASKPFGTPEQGAEVLEEVFGPGGLLSEVELDRDRSFGMTSYAFSAEADWSGGLSSLGDDELAQVLGGDPFGGNLERVEEETGKPAEEQVSLAVNVELPGGSETWQIEPGSGPQSLATESSEIRPVPWMLVVGAGIAFIAGLLLLVTRVARARRRRDVDGPEAPAPDLLEEPDEGPPSVGGADERGEAPSQGAEPGGVVAAPGPDAEEPPERRLRLVVLDAMGVVFTTGREIERILVEFVADKGSAVPESEVVACYHRAAEGRMTVGELWEALGVHGDPGDLSDELLALHHLVPGVREFLERMRARDLPVACVADDVAEWSRKLRSTHKLDGLTVLWLVSGDVGEQLPGAALCSRIIQTSRIEARDSFFISDRIENLEVARSFGFAVALFRPGGGSDGGPGYPVIESFADLGIDG